MGLADIFGRRRMSFLSSGILRNAVDSHSHVLPGVDDGVATLQEALAVLDYEATLGVTRLWCTPHVMEDTPNDEEFLRERFNALNAAYGGPVRLSLAAEYMIDTVFEERLHEGRLLEMDDSTVLVETSSLTPPVGLHEMLRDMCSAGYRPLLAHPERYRYLSEAGYERLRADGVHFQLNLPSMTGFYGETVMRKAQWLLRHGFYSKAGSDCYRLHVMSGQFERKVLSVETADALVRLLHGSEQSF